MLDKSSILTAQDLKREVVPVPEWGGDVLLQEMTALDRDRLQAETVTGDKLDTVNYAARILVRCIVAEDGSRIFEDADAESLGRKSPGVIGRLFTIASKLNGTVDDDDIKNFEPGLTESLLSDSV